MAPVSGSKNNVDPRWWLAALVLIGLAIRLWGIGWGLPQRPELHPDENDYVLRHALQLSLQRLDPGFLNYPAFLMYLIAAVFRGLAHLGWITGEPWQAHLIGRLWSALFATATILPVYAMAREIGGSVRAALLSALWMALLPLNIWEAHVAITDPLMTFWTAMTLWASVRLARTSRLHDYLLAGASLGLATGSKYTAAIAVVAVIAGSVNAFLRTRSFRETAGGLIAAGLLSVLCAYFVTPYSFIRWEDTLKALSYEYGHTHGQHYGFSLPAPGWQYRHYVYQFAAAWPFSLGIALYASALAGVGWALCRRPDRRLLPLLAFFIAFFGVTGSWSFVPLRYYLPLVTLLVLFAGLWHGALIESSSRAMRMAGLVLVTITLAYTLIFAIQTTGRFAHETRMAAGRWLDAHLKTGDRLLACGWSRYLAIPNRTPPGSAVIGLRNDAPLRKQGELDDAELIEITSLHYDRHVRAGDADWLRAYDRIRTNRLDYEPVARFEARFINRSLYLRLDPMYGGYFVSPTIEFYRRTPRAVCRSTVDGPRELGAFEPHQDGTADGWADPTQSSAQRRPEDED